MAEQDKGVEELLDRLLEGELTAHLGYEKDAPEGRNRGSSRNGKSTKRLKTETGELYLEIPRDREGSFDPVLVPKGQRRLPGFDEKAGPSPCPETRSSWGSGWARPRGPSSGSVCSQN